MILRKQRLAFLVVLPGLFGLGSWEKEPYRSVGLDMIQCDSEVYELIVAEAVKTSVVQGVVFLFDTPTAGIKVELFSLPDGRTRYTTRSGAGGAFGFDDVRAGTYRIASCYCENRPYSLETTQVVVVSPKAPRKKLDLTVGYHP